MMQHSGGEHGWEVFSLEYVVDMPLSTIFNAEVGDLCPSRAPKPDWAISPSPSDQPGARAVPSAGGEAEPAHGALGAGPEESDAWSRHAIYGVQFSVAAEARAGVRRWRGGGDCAAMEKYFTAFNFLWLLKRVEHALSASWQVMKPNQMAALERNAEGELARTLGGALRRCQSLRYEMSHFVTNLQYYLMFEVLEASWATFEKEMAAATDLDQLIAAHNRYLDEILKKSLLERRSEQLYLKLRTIFELVLRFRGLASRLHEVRATHRLALWPAASTRLALCPAASTRSVQLTGLRSGQPPPRGPCNSQACALASRLHEVRATHRLALCPAASTRPQRSWHSDVWRCLAGVGAGRRGAGTVTCGEAGTVACGGAWRRMAQAAEGWHSERVEVPSGVGAGRRGGWHRDVWRCLSEREIGAGGRGAGTVAAEAAEELAPWRVEVPGGDWRRCRGWHSDVWRCLAGKLAQAAEAGTVTCGGSRSWHSGVWRHGGAGTVTCGGAWREDGAGRRGWRERVEAAEELAPRRVEVPGGSWRRSQRSWHSDVWRSQRSWHSDVWRCHKRGVAQAAEADRDVWRCLAGICSRRGSWHSDVWRCQAEELAQAQRSWHRDVWRPQRSEHRDVWRGAWRGVSAGRRGAGTVTCGGAWRESAQAAEELAQKHLAAAMLAEERTRAGTWGSSYGDEDGPSISGFIHDDHEAVLEKLAEEYAQAVADFLVSLPTQKHVDLRFLLFRLDFSEYYTMRGGGQ
ncbi:hypothetical protein CYMTET_29332 [Cymbomonas tetramitiformis]|uniref:Gamma tubulin complex component C-terminal domain-containing protein n=1 Tax=Cymbomonas tetramitiformis TaxID=36881 RepID=A0AAE0FL03_9CHLO|nr:hypothetical protein CYMTET_29332 [Cymbomonas tetramitiformis]